MARRRISILSFLVTLSMTTLLTAQMHGPKLDWNDFADRHDIDGDGMVTLEELAATGPRLSSLDADGDGVISEADFDARRAEMIGGKLVHMADSDRDGQVGSEEWSRFQEALDPDGDGAFELADIKNLRSGQPHGGRSDMGGEASLGRSKMERIPAPEDLSNALDLDGDGQLTSNDLDLLFLRLDEDGDGFVAVQRPRSMHRPGSGE